MKLAGFVLAASLIVPMHSAYSDDSTSDTTSTDNKVITQAISKDTQATLSETSPDNMLNVENDFEQKSNDMNALSGAMNTMSGANKGAASKL